MKFLCFSFLLFLCSVRLTAQCPADDGSDLSGGSFTIDKACNEINTSNALFLVGTNIDIGLGGSLTINFTGGGLVYDQSFGGGSITIRGDGAGGDTDGVFTINNSDFTVDNVSITIQDGAELNVPDGNAIIGIGGLGTSTSLVLDGNFYIGSSLILNDGAFLTGSGNFDILNNLVENGAGHSAFSGTVNYCGGTCASLPVELVEFTAVVENQNVYLNWITASEINNERFEVERSLDGENFQMIGFVYGSGTTNEISNYNYTDYYNAPYNSICYYRLKQIDFDGVYEYSPMIKVSFEDLESKLTLYPSIVDNYVSIVGNEGLLYEMALYDVSGNTFLSINELTSLSNIQDVLNNQLQNLKPTMYLVKVRSESSGGVQVLKFMKQ